MLTSRVIGQTFAFILKNQRRRKNNFTFDIGRRKGKTNDVLKFTKEIGFFAGFLHYRENNIGKVALINEYWAKS